MFEGRLFFHQIGYNDRHYIFQVTTNFLFHPQIIFLFPSLLSLSNEYSINLNRSVTIKLAWRINPPLSIFLCFFPSFSYMKTYSPRVFNGRTPPFKLTRFRFVETYREESVKRLKKKKKFRASHALFLFHV